MLSCVSTHEFNFAFGGCSFEDLSGECKQAKGNISCALTFGKLEERPSEPVFAELRLASFGLH